MSLGGGLLQFAGDALGGLASSAAKDVFAQIAHDFAQAAGTASAWLWKVIGDSTAVKLGGPGFDTLVSLVAGIAVVVTMGLFLIQVITSVVRRDMGGLARAGKGIVIALLGATIAIVVTNELLAGVDAASNGLVRAASGGTISSLGQHLLLIGALGALDEPALMLVLAFVLLGAIVFIWAALMVRKLLIIVAAVFAPLAFAGSAADISTGWVRKWVEGMAALIASKLILVIMLLIGWFTLFRNLGAVGAGGVAGQHVGVTQDLSQVAAGGLILVLAAFAPWVALRLVHFTGDHMAMVHAHATSTTAGAATLLSAPQKLSVMRPTSSPWPPNNPQPSPRPTPRPEPPRPGPEPDPSNSPGGGPGTAPGAGAGGAGAGGAGAGAGAGGGTGGAGAAAGGAGAVVGGAAAAAAAGVSAVKRAGTSGVEGATSATRGPDATPPPAGFSANGQARPTPPPQVNGHRGPASAPPHMNGHSGPASAPPEPPLPPPPPPTQ